MGRMRRSGGRLTVIVCSVALVGSTAWGTLAASLLAALPPRRRSWAFPGGGGVPGGFIGAFSGALVGGVGLDELITEIAGP